jgi:hypothetical protein
MEDVVIIYCNLVYCTANWYIYDHLVHCIANWYIYDHLVYFLVIWYNFLRFGMLKKDKSGNPAWYSDFSHPYYPFPSFLKC